jgi:GT2 family glycosyltransferase
MSMMLHDRYVRSGTTTTTDPQAKQPLIVVIVLNWNGWQDSVACIKSLKRSTYQNFRILAVDNGSTNDSTSRLRQEFADIDIFETGENLGFAQGNNVGIRHALVTWFPEYLWLLNNDTLVEPETMTILERTAANNPRSGALGAVLVDMERPNIIQEWGGGRMGLWTGIAWKASPESPPNYISGASLFVRRACLEQCGLLDPAYFFFFEDTDLGYRIRNHGWDLSTAHNAIVRHKGSASVGAQSGAQFYWYRRGLIRFLRTYAPLPWLPILATTAARLLLAAASRNWPVVQGTWRGFRDGLAG